MERRRRDFQFEVGQGRLQDLKPSTAKKLLNTSKMLFEGESFVHIHVQKFHVEQFASRGRNIYQH